MNRPVAATGLSARDVQSIDGTVERDRADRGLEKDDEVNQATIAAVSDMQFSA